MKLISGLIAAAVAAGIAVGPFLVNGEGRTIRGLVADGIHVGGMTETELSSVLAEKNAKIASRSLTVRHDDIRRVWSYKELGVAMGPDEVRRIMALGRTGDILFDWELQWKALLGGARESLRISYDEKAFAARIEELSHEYGTPPEEARPAIDEEGRVSFAAVKPYIKIDEGTLREAAKNYLLSGNEGTIEIPVLQEKKAKLSEEERKAIDQVLSVYTTYFRQVPNRSANIERAARSIDGWVLSPGESFSYNGATGLRTRENGYLDAPVFFDGKLVPDAGGGVCQVSTTLFNAVLLAGLAVTERTCHFAPVAYAPIGRDATVADNYLDFCFTNVLPHPVYVLAVYEPGAITTYILGNHADLLQAVDLPEVENKTLPHTTVYKVDPSQAEERKEEEGNDGYDVTVVQQVTYSDGSRYQNSFRSVYDAVDTVITFKDAVKMEKEKKAAEKKEAEKQKQKQGAKEDPKKNPA